MRGWVVMGLLAAGSLWACGPHFPNNHLLFGEEDRAGTMPRPRFAEALRRQFPAAAEGAHGTVTAEGWSKWGQTRRADQADLAEALRASGMAAGRREAVLAEYAALREAMKVHADGGRWDSDYGIRWEVTRFDLAPYAPVLAGVPEEFALYVRGAAAYRSGDWAVAEVSWRRLLALPAEARRYRSVWAAFMLGKLLMERGEDGSGAWFERARTLAAGRFRDSAGLAWASVGWEARQALAAGRTVAAMHGYVTMFRQGTGNDRQVAVTSLHRVAVCQFAQEGGPSEAVVGDALCLNVLMAWALAHPEEVGRVAPAFVERLRSAGVSRVGGAARVAWVAYNGGLMATAAEWLALAPPEDVWGRWLQAKLLLRDGRSREALGVLEGLEETVTGWPDGGGRGGGGMLAPRRRFFGDLGVVRLHHRQFGRSMDAFLVGGFWLDAAHVAERLMTLAELDLAVAELSLGGRRERLAAPRDAERLRALLARRLARAGKWDRAVPLLPAAVQDEGERYRELLAAGRDAGRPAAERARALVDAGKLLREFGMELMGTELEPDFAVFEGRFAPGTVRRGAATEARMKQMQGVSPQLWPLMITTEEEARRRAETGAVPDRRYHYRYVAAALMWEAAGLLPDRELLTAEALWCGGTWLKTLDPKGADRYYKALVIRCRPLAVARMADRRRWFPSTFFAGMRAEAALLRLWELADGWRGLAPGAFQGRMRAAVLPAAGARARGDELLLMMDFPEPLMALYGACAAVVEDGRQPAHRRDAAAVAMEAVLEVFGPYRDALNAGRLVMLYSSEALLGDIALMLAADEAVLTAGQAAVPHLLRVSGARGAHAARASRWIEARPSPAARVAAMTAAGVPVVWLGSSEEVVYAGRREGVVMRRAPGEPAARAFSDFRELLGVSGARVTALAAAGTGIWVGSNRGLFVYDTRSESWSRVALPGGASAAPVATLRRQGGGMQVVWDRDGARSEREYDLVRRRWR